MLEPIDQFRAALARRGIFPKGGEITADGAGSIGEDRPTRQVGELQQRISELLAIGGGVGSDHDDPTFGLRQQVRHRGRGKERIHLGADRQGREGL